MCGYAFLKAQLAAKTQELPRNGVLFASWLSTIDVRCLCLFSLSVCVIILSFRWWRCSFNKGIRPLCSVWEQLIGFRDLKRNPLIMSFFFCPLADLNIILIKLDEACVFAFTCSLMLIPMIPVLNNTCGFKSNLTMWIQLCSTDYKSPHCLYDSQIKELGFLFLTFPNWVSVVLKEATTRVSVISIGLRSQ